MALFKIFKGRDSEKITNPDADGYKIPTDGYAYYDTSSKLFYIDADYDGNGTIKREPINAEKANMAVAAGAAVQDSEGNKISETYLTDVIWDSTNKKLKKVINGVSIDIATIDNAYNLPTASSVIKGGVKVGTGLTISNEILSVKLKSTTVATTEAIRYTTGQQIAVGLDKNNNLSITLPIYSGEMVGG